MIKNLLTTAKGKLFSISLAAYLLTLLVYSVFSYSLTAPNLILSTWPPFWNFQTSMWQVFYNDRVLLGRSFVVLSIALFVSFGFILKAIRRGALDSLTKNTRSKILLAIAIVALTATPLLFSNNALSYDVFNYIFNAKMVLVYKADPHVQVALDFASDNWTRFMHNTHTPAPYGKGWTLFSLIPYSLGFGKFLPIWLSFRVFSLLSLLITTALLTYYSIQRKTFSWFWLMAVVLNPLTLIEVVSNIHNDLWMMAPAIGAFLLITELTKEVTFSKKVLIVVASFGLLIFSISVKLATLVITPLWALLVIYKLMPSLGSKKWWEFVEDWWPVLASLGLGALLLTIRSKQFLPWYLTWALVWLPLFPSLSKKYWDRLLSFWKAGLLILSISAFWRYLPYLRENNYSQAVISQQLALTWLPFILYLVIGFFVISFPKLKKVQ